MEFLIFYVAFSTIVSFVILVKENKWHFALILSLFCFILFPIAIGVAISEINNPQSDSK
jgi:uncharacterized membrane protein